jgi:hypothetical protein
MSNFTEQLSDRLHELVDDEVAEAAPTGAVLHRGRQARRRRTATLALSGVLALAVAGGVTSIALTDRPASGPAVAASGPASVPAPAVVLAAAATNTSRTSYRIRVVTETTGYDTQTTTGAFDPATRTGYVDTLVGQTTYRERLIGGLIYLGGSWNDVWKQDGQEDRIPFVRDLDGAPTASADPEQLLDVLRKAGGTVTATGPDAYHFTVSVSPEVSAEERERCQRDPARKGCDELGQPPVTSFVGDITVADERLATVSYESTFRGSVGGWTQRVRIAYSGYGEPVVVAKPENVVYAK